MPSTIPFISSPELSIEQRDSVLWLTITREERRNAMSHGVLANMAAAVNQAQSHRDIRAIVVTGAGSKAFCAGADLQSAMHSPPITPSRKATWPRYCAPCGPAIFR